MPDLPITSLTPAAALALDTIFPVVLDPLGSPALRSGSMQQVKDAAGGALAGAGSPEGVVSANPGVTYLNTTNESFWVKKTGTGNTGWIALIS